MRSSVGPRVRVNAWEGPPAVFRLTLPSRLAPLSWKATTATTRCPGPSMKNAGRRADCSLRELGRVLELRPSFWGQKSVSGLEAPGRQEAMEFLLHGERGISGAELRILQCRWSGRELQDAPVGLHRPFTNRWPGWATLGFTSLGLILRQGPMDLPPALVWWIPAISGFAFFYSEMGTIYHVPPRHRPRPQGDKQVGDQDNVSGRQGDPGKANGWHASSAIPPRNGPGWISDGLANHGLGDPFVTVQLRPYAMEPAAATDSTGGFAQHAPRYARLHLECPE